MPRRSFGEYLRYGYLCIYLHLYHYDILRARVPRLKEIYDVSKDPWPAVSTNMIQKAGEMTVYIYISKMRCVVCCMLTSVFRLRKNKPEALLSNLVFFCSFPGHQAAGDGDMSKQLQAFEFHVNQNAEDSMQMYAVNSYSLFATCTKTQVVSYALFSK